MNMTQVMPGRIRKRGSRKCLKGHDHLMLGKQTALFLCQCHPPHCRGSGRRQPALVWCVSGNGGKLQMPLAEMPLAINERKKSRHWESVVFSPWKGTARSGPHLWGKKNFPRLSLLPCSTCLHTPDVLGFPLPRTAPDSPSPCAPEVTFAGSSPRSRYEAPRVNNILGGTIYF